MNRKRFPIIIGEILFILISFSLIAQGVQGEVWRSDVLGKGTHSSLELGNFNNPHVTYYDSEKGNLIYARLTKRGWEYETVDSDKDVGKYNSLALDENNIPHISYYNSDDGNLKYATLHNDNWVFETIHADGDVGKYTSIDLDGNGRPHISYYDSSNGKLMHAKKGVELWKTETVDSEGDVGKYSSLDIEGGNIHIAYHDSEKGNLRYALYAGDVWETDVVDVESPSGKYTSIDSLSEQSHIMHYNTKDGSLKHTYFDGDWRTETVDNRASLSGDVSLKIVNGRLYITYSNQDNHLVYAMRDEGWKSKVVKNSSFVSSDISLDIGKYGRAYVSYMDLNSNKVKYLTYYTVPSRPKNLRAIAGDGSVKLQWTEPENSGGKPIEEHYLYRSGPSEDLERITTLDSPKTSYLDTSVENEMTYSYYVTALNVIGESERSNRIEANPSSTRPLGGNEFEEVEVTTTTIPEDIEDKEGKEVEENVFDGKETKGEDIPLLWIAALVVVIILILFFWKRRKS